MAEVGNMPLPPKLLKRGVTDVVRISDARMSGTAYGTVVLHAAPEAAAGGPLALVRNGDAITLDVAGRRLHLGGRLTRMEIAQAALQFLAYVIAGFGGDRGFETRHLFAEQAEAARGHEVGADRNRPFELGFFMFVVALAAKGYAHRLFPEGFAPLGHEGGDKMAARTGQAVLLCVIQTIHEGDFRCVTGRWRRCRWLSR